MRKIVLLGVLDRLFFSIAEVKLCPTPGGFHPCDCIHTVDSGTQVDELVDPASHERKARFHFPNGSVVDIAHCPHKRPPLPHHSDHGSVSNPCKLGWAHAAPMEAFYRHTKDIASFTATYVVPDTPQKNDGNILYYWIGLQDLNSSANPVIQPVLSFLDTWYFESWNCCPAGHKIRSVSVPVKGPGETLKGSIERDSSGKYAITSTNSAGKSSVLISNDTSSGIVYTWNWVDIVLETYSIDSCSEYSAGNDMKFLDMTLVDMAGGSLVPKWTLNPYINGVYLPPREAKTFQDCCNGSLILDWPSVSMHNNGGAQRATALDVLLTV